ncbi:ATP-binding protein [Noviherbaspirillum sp.]|uniref:ATP-binding protein n=1 Tax=Noviherbaspirillum sp. TaxID=1926288 RepID=UPI002B46225C|nr:ATP-binding protein [Noviherbaspirillum sp.]HJV80248.1 ATP-binding protein [Noviherbaspirillum sp.]
MNKLEEFLANANRLIDEVRLMMPPSPPPIAWEDTVAFTWRRQRDAGYLEPVRHPQLIDISDLQGNRDKFDRVELNTRQFVRGLPANNVLLTGARGTGKSSIVKALLKKYASQGLRLIEVEKSLLTDLPAIVDAIRHRPERFIIFCDDLSFEAEEPGYKALKVMLDGSVTSAVERVLIYATSNRRHLVPEYMRENTQMDVVNGEIHQNDSVDEKISLSERFGVWVHFYPFAQEEYLQIARHWLSRLNPGIVFSQAVQDEALGWALQRGSRSGRVALQFARDYCGRHAVDSMSFDK